MTQCVLQEGIAGELGRLESRLVTEEAILILKVQS